MNTKTIKLDINKKLYQRITAKQRDTKSRYLFFHLLDGAIPFNLTNRSVRVYAIKPDGTEIFNDLQIVDAAKGICKLELTTQILAVSGIVLIELMIMEGESKLTSIPFELEVIKSLNSTSAIESSNEYKALDEALIKTDKWNKEFEDKSGKLEELYTPRLNEVSSHLAENAKQIEKKVDKVEGKGLSTNDYDNLEKIEVGKVKNKMDSTKGSSIDKFLELYVGEINKSLNGYCSLPNGMIMQWGYIGNGNLTQTIYLPISFNNKNYNVQITPYLSEDTTGLTWSARNVNNYYFQVGSTKVAAWYWLAIGWVTI